MRPTFRDPSGPTSTGARCLEQIGALWSRRPPWAPPAFTRNRRPSGLNRGHDAFAGGGQKFSTDPVPLKPAAFGRTGAPAAYNSTWGGRFPAASSKAAGRCSPYLLTAAGLLNFGVGMRRPAVLDHSWSQPRGAGPAADAPTGARLACGATPERIRQAVRKRRRPPFDGGPAAGSPRLSWRDNLPEFALVDASPGRLKGLVRWGLGCFAASQSRATGRSYSGGGVPLSSAQVVRARAAGHSAAPGGRRAADARHPASSCTAWRRHEARRRGTKIFTTPSVSARTTRR